MFDDDIQPCFDRVSACVKGYLTRRLLKTEKVQEIIRTVQVLVQNKCREKVKFLFVCLDLPCNLVFFPCLICFQYAQSTVMQNGLDCFY